MVPTTPSSGIVPILIVQKTSTEDLQRKISTLSSPLIQSVHKNHPNLMLSQCWVATASPAMCGAYIPVHAAIIVGIILEYFGHMNASEHEVYPKSAISTGNGSGWPVDVRVLYILAQIHLPILEDLSRIVAGLGMYIHPTGKQPSNA